MKKRNHEFERFGSNCGGQKVRRASIVSADLSTHATPAYVQLDIGLTWRPTQSLELSVWGQDLLDDRHSEIFSFHTSFLTEVPRGIHGKLT